MMNIQADTPKNLGRFELLEAIGHGATATVYKARHQATGRLAAIKVGASFMGLENGALERFKREFTAIRALTHPNLVRAFALAEHDSVPYIVMEYMRSENLEQRLKRTGPLRFEEAAVIFRQVAAGLQYLHANRILHRDIKPSNILLDEDQHAKLGDFGLMKCLTDDCRLTVSRQSMGTMEYGAPEQFEDAKRVDFRCDLYSLAGSLYTALTAKVPFGNGGHLQIMQRKLLNQFVPLRLLLPSLDPAVDQLVSRCLRPKVSERPTDCAEFLAVMRDWNTRFEPPAGADDIDLSAGAGGNGADRRATVRFAADLTTTFVPFHQNLRGRWQATILDVSPAGLRLRTPRSVAVNSVLQISLMKKAPPELALVRWVKPGARDTQVVGCSFVRTLSEREVEAICGVGAKASAD